MLQLIAKAAFAAKAEVPPIGRTERRDLQDDATIIVF